MRTIFMMLMSVGVLAAAQPYVDKSGGLMWQDDGVTANTKMTWYEASQYCKDLKIGNYDDWRLPTVRELLTLVDYRKEDPAFISQIRYVHSGDYWTSVTDVSDTSDAWLVFFEHGEVDNYDKSHKRYLRCVRSLKTARKVPKKASVTK